MNPPLHPTRKCLTNMEAHGQTWPEVEADLVRPEVVSPVLGFDTRLQVLGEKFTAFVEPGRKDGQDVWFVVGIRTRTRATEPSPVQVVGIEPKRSHRRSHGGGGKQWPSTWEELRKRIEGTPGWTVEQAPGSSHLNVRHNDQLVTALPMTASEYRGLLNACLNLKRRGLDLRR